MLARDSTSRTGRCADFAAAGAEDLMIPQCLAAKAAADKRRTDEDLRVLDVEHLCQRAGRAVQHLRGVMHDEPVAVPADGCSMGFDGAVTYAKACDRRRLRRWLPS